MIFSDVVEAIKQFSSVSRIFRGGSKTKKRASPYKGFRKLRSGARTNKDTNTLSLLDILLREERREEIYQNYLVTKQHEKEGRLDFSSDIDQLMTSLEE
jgi:uncharacterized FlgJ-related protein